ncbi:MAG TPA: penicillin acylase family protein [Vicinamibacterales bacterium]|jgi:penicillin amidase
MTRTLLVLAAAACALGAFALMPSQAALDDLARQALARIDGEIDIPQASGLRANVRVARDEWGIPHITASSPEDLFFAQGYVAAQDRLWQMEIWRRTAEGRLAEISGPQAVPTDRLARLLKFRGPSDDRELAPYHPDARRLMAAFVSGVNTFIAQHQQRLPIEFVLTGITPEPWTIDTLTLRQVTFGDATNELQLARSIATLGVAEANRRRNPDPWDDLTIPAGLDVAAITNDVMGAARTGGRIPAPPLLPAFRAFASPFPDGASSEAVDPGSNNWVVSGALSTTGKPVVANDPHREVTLPSLRFIMHLTAPGWNVIGAAEPPFLGIALGHNDFVAWGLTIVGTDQHDVYVEDVNPSNANEVRFGKAWEPLKIVREEIRVKGATPVQVELKFSRHGPIFFEDPVRRRAYALRSALHEPGAAPYLAGLRLSQTKNCREFLTAAAHWNAPSENLICGDVQGNIAWRASALTPNRKGWTGRLPVPGTGAYEWHGFRSDLPSEYNPASGFIATANHNVQPKGYSPPFMFKTADTRFERITRLRQMIAPGRKYSLEDHQRMQHDAFSLRAAADIPRFRNWTSSDPAVEKARALLAAWDAVYKRDSVEAALYETWRAQPADLDLAASLRAAIARLEASQGSAWTSWRWGRMHARAFPHVLIRAFDLPAVERPGGAGSVAADGASYREILDVSDWDRSLATNTPGQSGQPGSPFYGNLLPLWAENKYFPLAFSQKAVDARTKHRLTLRAARR